jgi:hypothetical protein
VRAALACLLAGAGLIVATDAGAALAAGVLLLAAFVVLGLLALASPERLAGEEDAEEP